MRLKIKYYFFIFVFFITYVVYGIVRNEFGSQSNFNQFSFRERIWYIMLKHSISYIDFDLLFKENGKNIKNLLSENSKNMFIPLDTFTEGLLHAHLNPMDLNKVDLREYIKIDEDNQMEIYPSFNALFNVGYTSINEQIEARTIFNKIFKFYYDNNLFTEIIFNSNKNQYLTFYNPEGIKSAFEKIYPEPSDRLNKITYSIVYNYIFKDFIRRKTNLIIEIISDQAELDKYTKDYVVNVFEKETTNAVLYTNRITELYCSRLQINSINKCDPILVGTIIRRNYDKTLNLLLNLLNRVLHDYDIIFAKEINLKKYL